MQLCKSLQQLRGKFMTTTEKEVRDTLALEISGEGKKNYSVQAGAGAGRCGDAAVRAVGAARRRGRCHLLDDHLTAAAELCAHKAAGKAHGCGQHQRHRTACDAPAGALLLFAGRLCAGLRLHRLYRRRGAACSAGRLRLCCACLRLRVIVLVGGIHAAAAHIGIAGAAFGSILRGIIIFPLVLVAHVDTSFP